MTEPSSSRPLTRLRRALTGIRTRVVLASIALLLAALAASVLATRQLLLVGVIEQADRDTTQEAEELRALAGGNDPATGLPFGNDAEAVFDTFLSRNVPARDEAFYAFVDGRPYLTSFNAPDWVFDDAAVIERWSNSSAPVRGATGTGSTEIRYLVVPVESDDRAVLGTFVIAIFPEADRAEVSKIVRTILVIAFTVLGLSSIAAWSLAGRVLRPVRALTGAARITDANDLTKRIPVDGNDELAELGTTFNGMLDRLDESFRSQRAFLDDVAHELRTPITIVRGHLEMMDDDPVDQQATVRLVTDELDRMARYVDDLLVVAKAAQPDFLHLELVDIAELIDGAYQRARGLGDRDWTLGAAPPPATVLSEADADRLLQALLALADNARQHTAPGGVITLGADATDDEIRLWVTDDGPGVPDEERERIFQRFSRGASSERRPEGAGLGLPIVAAIARAHYGRVELESHVGHGATFRIVLPRSILQEDSP
ncbi:MAG: HAMP domain-containing sensor histidine kinase [Actinomycetota bacterium]|nr:HAMP domain-containing sensor histidine kinase [Actinomycetota bacterium]